MEWGVGIFFWYLLGLVVLFFCGGNFSIYFWGGGLIGNIEVWLGYGKGRVGGLMGGLRKI